MHVLLIDKLVIPENRQRRRFDEAALKDLALDIDKNGLIHAIAFRQENGAAVLVAGERRLRAAKLLAAENKQIRCNGEILPLGAIAGLTLGELSPLEAMEAELSENTVRLDLTWPERNAAIARLHELRLAQNPRQTIKDTASEVAGSPAQGSAITRTHEAVLIHQHMADPEIAKAKSHEEAMKILRKKKEAAKRVELAKTFDLSATPHIAKRGDSAELIACLNKESVDVIITDPPYGIDADKFGDQAGTGHSYTDSPEAFNAIRLWLPDQCFRVAKKQAHLYMFCDWSNFSDLTAEFTFAGWWVWPRPLIWSKGSGMLPYPGKGPRYTYECILYAIKGDRSVIFDAQPDVIAIPSVKTPRHGAEKPVDLYAELLRRSCNPGNTVLDPFMGSGPIFPAANRLKLTAIGFEQDETHYALAISRLHETELGSDPTLNI